MKGILSRKHAVSVIVGLAWVVVTSTPIYAADSPIALKSTAQIEQLVKQPDGTLLKKMQPFKSAPPGQEVVFTNTMTNTSKRVADNLVLSNPVPKNMRLAKVWANGAVETDFSVDGKSFAKAESLTVKTDNGMSRPATVADYTDIRWKVASLKPGEVLSVGFNAVIK